MSDISNTTWQFLKDNQFIVGALSGSLAAYVLGLVVTHLRREKRWLGYSISSRNIVSKRHTKLSMKYENETIERLDSCTVVLRNIGNRALRNIPATLQLATAGSILDFEVAGPEGSNTERELETPAKLVVTPDLLNPGESVRVGLTIADSPDGAVSVVARGELLEVKQVTEGADLGDLLETLAQHSPLWGRIFVEMFRFAMRRAKP